MKYYLIFLYAGRVMDICSYDDQQTRDKQYNKVMFDPAYANPRGYDDVQYLDVVN